MDNTDSFPIPVGPETDPPRVRRDFPVVLRGYDRHAVDDHLADLEEDVGELYAQRSPQAVVRRALDKVGEETSAILQRAHETADEITRKSRQRATERIEEADREAAQVRAAADAHVRALDESVDAIWSERHRLIEDVRRVGETLVKIAEEAMTRFPPAEGPPTPPRPVPAGAAPATPAARSRTEELEALEPDDVDAEPQPTMAMDRPPEVEPEVAEAHGEPEAGEPDTAEQPRVGNGDEPEFRGEEPGFPGEEPGFRGDEPGFRAEEPGFRGGEPEAPGDPREPLPDEGIQSIRPIPRDP